MTEYGSGAWVSRARRRKAARDKDREAFWERTGVERLRDVSAVAAAPREQRVPVVRLLQVTRDGGIDPDFAAFLPLIALQLRATGLGLGAMGTVAENLTDLSQFQTRVLEHFFSHDYKFEGPRAPDE